jgi:hypothetical protein
MSDESVDSKAEAVALAAKLKTAEEDKAKAEARAAQLQTELDDAVKRRKAASEKEKTELEKRLDYEAAKKLLEDENAALKAQTAEIETLKSKAAKADEMIEARRQELLAKLPEDKRDAFKDDTAEQITKALSLIPEENQIPPTDKGKPPARGNNDGVKWDKLPRADQIKWIEEHKTPSDPTGSKAIQDRIIKENRTS